MYWREARIDEEPEVTRRLQGSFGEAPPAHGIVYVLDVDGQIRGIAVAQYILHLEPVELDPEVRSFSLTALRKLRDVLTSDKRLAGEHGIVATALSPAIARMHRWLGFESLGKGEIMRIMR